MFAYLFKGNPYTWKSGLHIEIKSLEVGSIQRGHLTTIRNPIVDIRWSYHHLISTMGFPILARWHLYIESGPKSSSNKFCSDMHLNSMISEAFWALPSVTLELFPHPLQAAETNWIQLIIEFSWDGNNQPMVSILWSSGAHFSRLQLDVTFIN